MIKNTFESYRNEPYALDFDKMRSLHGELLTEIGDDPDAAELYDDLTDAAAKYAAIRAVWLGMSAEERAEADPMRTSHHDSLIVHFNMLARYLRMQGKSASWRDELGNEEENRYFRKTIGDFGCYIVFVNSICAR